MPPYLTYDSPYDAAYFSGSPSATDLVPGIFDLAIDGHPYMLDFSHDDVETIEAWLREETPPILRPQADQANEPGEQSISPEVTWRRSQETWHKGAGQTYFDRTDSDRARFRSSKGVDIWTKWTLGLLEQTEKVDTFSGGSGSSVLIVNARAYASSGGNNLRTSPDPLTTWTAVTGIPGAVNCTSLATDGIGVYSAWGTSGIYKTDSVATPTTAASYVTGSVSMVAYLKGRLLAAFQDKLYEITASGALPAAFYDHPNAGWTWTGLAEGSGFIYAAGYAGTHSNVYKITVEKETTALGAPTAALQGLPPGEIIHSIHGALGFIFLGTSRGVRFCVPADNGDLQVGSLIETPAPVRCFTTWDRFTYFGWSNYDAASSGLGRLDPAVINSVDALVPAYASDAMATVTGTVNGVAILPGTANHGHPVFTIDASGVWRCVPDQPVASGDLRTGLISYGVADYKLAVYLDERHDPLPSGTSIEAALAADGGTEDGIGVSTSVGTIGPGPLNCNQRRAELFELVFTLNGKTTTTYAKPALRRWTLRSVPAPTRPSTWTLPLLFEESLLSPYDITYPFDPETELAFLRTLHHTARVVTFQFGIRSFPVIVTDLVYRPDRATRGDAVPNFTWTGRLQVTLAEVVA